MGKKDGEKIDYQGKKIGMWLFIFTELLFFGGLFLLYSVFRYRFPLDFHLAAKGENLVLGSVNTAVLLSSSAFIAISVSAIKKDRATLSVIFQGLTILLGLVFLGIKYIEWSEKIYRGIYPSSPNLLQLGNGETLFFGLYFVMTGIHGLHVLIGIIVIGFMLAFTVRRKITSSDFIKLENTGLYWHFVDIVWIYLFPLFYLIT
jgi:cytochrome c oxidase subunit III